MVDVVESVSLDLRSKEEFVSPAIRLAAILLAKNDPPESQAEAVKLAVEAFITGATYGIAAVIAADEQVG